jgi:hypothetical protein
VQRPPLLQETIKGGNKLTVIAVAVAVCVTSVIITIAAVARQ